MNVFKHLPVPSISPSHYDGAHEFMWAFYRSLNWNPDQQMLHPKRVKLNAVTWMRFSEELGKFKGSSGEWLWEWLGPGVDESLALSPNMAQIDALAFTPLRHIELPSQPLADSKEVNTNED